jgi:hypothetical protein
VYGEAQTSERFKTWDMLKYIKSTTNLSWMCIGDFNEVLHQHEHEGVVERSLAQIQGLRQMYASLRIWVLLAIVGLLKNGSREVPSAKCGLTGH